MTAASLRPRLAVSAVITALIALALALPALASAAEFPLTINEEGTGTGVVECEVEAVVSPCEAEYEEETEVNLIAEADPGSEFIEFWGDCGPLDCELTMDEAHTVNVVFEAEEEIFPLTVETFGTGSGTVECEVESGPAEPCEEEYAEGTEISLVADADPGSEFTEWLEDCSGTGSCELTMDEAHSVTALFEAEPEEFALNIEELGSGSGTVECEAQEGLEPCQAIYPAGTELTVLGTPDPGSEFVEFGGDCEPAECHLTMDEEHTVSLLFELEEPPEEEFSLTVNLAGGGEGEVLCEVEGEEAEECEAEYFEGTELTLVPEPEAGSEFTGFSAGTGSATGCTGTSPCTFTLNANSSVTATFELEAPPAPTVTSVAPNKGTTAGGTAVTITGTNLTGATEVKYGTTAVTCTGVVATCKVESSTEIKATTPAHGAGEVDVRVITPGGESATGAGDKFTFEAPASPPTVTSVAPNKGTTAGGTAVTITGTNLTGATEVKFGSTAAASFEVKSATQIKATSPAHAAGQVDITVTTPGGTSATGAGDKFTFETPVVVTHTLTIVKAGSGSGTVTCDGGACASSYPEGTKITLAASADSGSTFLGWSGGGCSGTGDCVITLNADTTVNATFDKQPGGGGGGGGGTPPAGVVSAAPTAPVSGGKAALKLSCSGGPCSGSLTLTAKVKQGKKTKNLTIGKASFSLADGTTATIKVKLSGPAKQELAKGKTVKAKLSGTGVISSKVKLKLAKKK